MKTLSSVDLTVGGITFDGLLARIDSAEKALNRKQPAIAVQLLEAFIFDVEAQAGKQISPDSAASLTKHAHCAIDKILSTRLKTLAPL